VKAQEHRALGDEASGGATVDLAGGSGVEPLVVSFGDVVALSGDYFYPTAEPPLPSEAVGSGRDALASGGLFHLAAVAGDRGRMSGTRDEVICALKVMAVDQGVSDPRFDADGEFGTFHFTAAASETDVERRVRDRFLALGASNDDHFVAPGERGRETAGDRAPARFGSAAAAYRRMHQLALDEACRIGRSGGDMGAAMAREAAAQHYLTDAFAAGHLRTPVASIREFWQARYPWFWERLQKKVAADTARALRELARPLRMVPSRYLYDRTLSAVQSRTVGYPRVSFGDLLAKVFHDWDNRHGVVLEDGEMVFGDGCLDRGATRKLAVAGTRAGIDDVEVAFGFGGAGRTLTGEALYAAVREATGAEGDEFVAEAKIPRLSEDNPALNWRAADVEELWETPIVGSSGTTVGEAVSDALQEGEELPNRLECLGRGIAGSLNLPATPAVREWLDRKACQAYHRGFLSHLMSDPRGSLLEVVGAGETDGSGVAGGGG
jgi:hypothetical protein